MVAGRNVIWVGELGYEAPAIDWTQVGEAFGRGLAKPIEDWLEEQSPEFQSRVALTSYKIYTSLPQEKRRILEQSPGFARWRKLWARFGILPEGAEPSVLPEDLQRKLTEAKLTQAQWELEASRELHPLRRKRLELELAELEARQDLTPFEKELLRAKLLNEAKRSKLLEAQAELYKAQAEAVPLTKALTLAEREEKERSRALDRFIRRKEQLTKIYTMITDPTKLDVTQRPTLATSWIAGINSLIRSAERDPYLKKTGTADLWREEAITQALSPQVAPYLLQNPTAIPLIEDLINGYAKPRKDVPPEEVLARVERLKILRPVLQEHGYDLIFDKERGRFRIKPLPKPERGTTLMQKILGIFR